MCSPAGSLKIELVFKSDREAQETVTKAYEELRQQREERKEGEYQAYLRWRKENGYVF